MVQDLEYFHPISAEKVFEKAPNCWNGLKDTGKNLVFL
jgi:hypothetical protein